MKCYVCETTLIWGGDQDIDHEYYDMETNLSCPNCGAYHTVSMRTDNLKFRVVDDAGVDLKTGKYVG